MNENNMICGCGRPVRYQIGNEMACNKYMRCVPVEEPLTTDGPICLDNRSDRQSVIDLTASLAEAQNNHQCEKHLSEILFNRAVRAEKELAEEREQYEETEKDHLNQITQLVVDKIKLKAELSKWITYHDAAVEDAKNWRRDAQELQGVVNDIRAELQSRNIHLLSKHCWCEPTGHPWTQKGTVAE